MSVLDRFSAQAAGYADLTVLVAEELTRLWGPGPREVTFPVFARAGRTE